MKPQGLLRATACICGRAATGTTARARANMRGTATRAACGLNRKRLGTLAAARPQPRGARESEALSAALISDLGRTLRTRMVLREFPSSTRSTSSGLQGSRGDDKHTREQRGW